MSVPNVARFRPYRAALLAMALAAILPACKKDDAEAAAAEQAAAAAMAVSTAPVLRREMPRGLTVSGPVAPVEEMQLGVEVTGLRVTALNVDVGQQVRRGQVLLTLDHRTLDSDLAQANAALWTNCLSRNVANGKLGADIQALGAQLWPRRVKNLKTCRKNNVLRKRAAFREEQSRCANHCRAARG